jgi:hypothetical protein
MKIGNLGDMKKGWLVGDFNPVFYRDKGFEVAVKKYKAGEREEKHFHRVAKEITVIAQGEVRMNGVNYKENEILMIEPLEAVDFYALKDTITVVVKIPSVKDDKIIANE